MQGGGHSLLAVCSSPRTCCSAASKYMVLRIKAGAPQEKGTEGEVGTEAYLLPQVSKGLLDGGEHREVRTPAQTLLGTVGNPIRLVRTNVVDSGKWNSGAG